MFGIGGRDLGSLVHEYSSISDFGKRYFLGQNMPEYVHKYFFKSEFSYIVKYCREEKNKSTDPSELTGIEIFSGDKLSTGFSIKFWKSNFSIFFSRLFHKHSSFMSIRDNFLLIKIAWSTQCMQISYKLRNQTFSFKGNINAFFSF